MPWSSKRWGPDGFTEEHSAGDRKDTHEGSVEDCSAPECQWPQVGTRVLWPEGGQMLLCKMIERDDLTAMVELPGGGERRGLRRWAREVEWGEYCPHGVRIIEAVLAEHTCKEPKPPCDRVDEFGHLCIDHWPVCHACYPTGRKILPWACGKEGCSEEAYDRDQQELADEYHREMWDLYRSNQ